MCFAFIFIWHGLSWEVFLWTLFNFIGITIETLARVFGKTSCYFHYVKVIIIVNFKGLKYTTSGLMYFKID